MRKEVLRETREFGHLPPCLTTDTGDDHVERRFAALTFEESRKDTGIFRDALPDTLLFNGPLRGLHVALAS
jgi:hypothetical protein